ncbi:hypothetical protein RJ639_008928 [Escallonia herrerae]|uniref:BUB1 N-terminal domain-containing protein n=1 Tax=Escallonia herrerae TaxID=1293975 RepID=A0AA88VSR7_9ASTE|nr:hypothetical protein RJ639_008928 [Escallonia herrerae]
MENLASVMDPETEFLASKQETGHEWELFKENVRPLKRGRNVKLLNDALKSYSDNQLKKSLLDQRRKSIEAIDEYKGEDPLLPWLECVKWVQEAFPPGGDCSGLVMIYEQCVRTFWHDDRYRDDLRYLKVWLEYAESCIDAEVIYSFLNANKIGQTHAVFFISYALLMESKNKTKTANDIFNRGISMCPSVTSVRNAQPSEKLKAAYRKFLAHSMRRPKATDDVSTENHLPMRSFGTVLATGQNRTQTKEITDLGRKKLKQERTPLAIYNDNNAGITMGHELELSKSSVKSWHVLGARAERNKENSAIPAKWTSNKIPQRPGDRVGAAASAPIQVFVDEECKEMGRAANGGGRSSTLQLRRGDGQDLKKETELLREHPLRNFPLSCLPR